jgi:hypothetical protein
MSTFTIDPDNNITALVEVPAGADRSTTFSTEEELAKLVRSSWRADLSFSGRHNVTPLESARGVVRKSAINPIELSR